MGRGENPGVQENLNSYASELPLPYFRLHRQSIQTAIQYIQEAAQQLLAEAPEALGEAYRRDAQQAEEQANSSSTERRPRYAGISAHDVIDEEGLEWKARIAELRATGNRISDHDRNIFDRYVKAISRDLDDCTTARLCHRAAERVLNTVLAGDSADGHGNDPGRREIAYVVRAFSDRAGSSIRGNENEMETFGKFAQQLARVYSTARSRVPFDMEQPGTMTTQALLKDLNAPNPPRQAQLYAEATFHRNLDSLLGRPEYGDDNYIGRFERIRVGDKSVQQLCKDATVNMTREQAARYMMRFVVAKSLERDQTISIAPQSRSADRPAAFVPLVPVMQTNDRRPNWILRLLGKLGLYRSEFLDEQRKQRAYERELSRQEARIRAETYIGAEGQQQSAEAEARGERAMTQRHLLMEMKKFNAPENSADAFFNIESLRAIDLTVHGDNPNDFFMPDKLHGLNTLFRDGSRASLAHMFMYSKGYSTEEIFSDDPEMMHAKGEVGKELYSILRYGTPEKIADTYVQLKRALYETPFPNVDPKNDDSIAHHYIGINMLGLGATDINQSLGGDNEALVEGASGPTKARIAIKGHIAGKMGGDQELYENANKTIQSLTGNLCQDAARNIAQDDNYSTDNYKQKIEQRLTPTNDPGACVYRRLVADVMEPGARAAAGQPLGACRTDNTLPSGLGQIRFELGSSNVFRENREEAIRYANRLSDVCPLQSKLDAALDVAGTSMRELPNAFAVVDPDIAARLAHGSRHEPPVNESEPTPVSLTELESMHGSVSAARTPVTLAEPRQRALGGPDR